MGKSYDCFKELAYMDNLKFISHQYRAITFNDNPSLKKFV